MERKDNPRLWQIWYDMKYRCGRRKNYLDVGYHEDWEDFSVFADWALNNGYEEGLTIDRKDFKDDYKPSNCRFITKQEQQYNKSNNKMITFRGETKCLKQWAVELGINSKTLSKRLSRGMPLEKAMRNVNHNSTNEAKERAKKRRKVGGRFI